MSAAYTRNIYLCFALRSVDGMSWLTVPTFVLFWRSIGMNISQMMAVQLLFGIMWAVFEVPTGFFADRFGRRNSLLIGLLLRSLGHFIYALSDTMVGVVISEILCAAGTSFVSGAASALLFDSLLADGRHAGFDRLNGRADAFLYSTGAVGCIAGAWLSQFGLRVPLIGCAIVELIGVITVFFVIEPPRAGERFENVFSAVKDVLRLAGESREFSYFLLYPMVIYSLAHASLWFYQPYLSALEIEQVHLGRYFALFYVTSGISAWFTKQTKDLWGIEVTTLALPAVLIICLLLLAGVLHPIGILVICVLHATKTIIYTFFIGELHRVTPSNLRATVLSVQSMFTRILCGTLQLAGGVVVDVLSLQSAFLLFGVLLSAVLIVAVWHPHDKNGFTPAGT